MRLKARARPPTSSPWSVTSAMRLGTKGWSASTSPAVLASVLIGREMVRASSSEAENGHQRHHAGDDIAQLALAVDRTQEAGLRQVDDHGEQPGILRRTGRPPAQRRPRTYWPRHAC